VIEGSEIEYPSAVARREQRDDRAFIAELVANAPALSESQKDTIRAAFRETSRAAT
jgi:hypothetical protein